MTERDPSITVDFRLGTPSRPGPDQGFDNEKDGIMGGGKGEEGHGEETNRHVGGPHKSNFTSYWVVPLDFRQQRRKVYGLGTTSVLW